MLAEAKKLPTSSHPSIGQFLEAYESASDAEEVLCITCTGKMSGTYQTACAAQSLIQEQGYRPKLLVYDSNQVSHGMELMLLRAARLRDEGCTAQEIIADLDRYQTEIGHYVVCKSLKNLRKGGRTGAIKVLAAEILGKKPFLQFTDGLVYDRAVAKSFPDGLDMLYKKYCEEANPEELCVVYHAENKPDAAALCSRIRAAYPNAVLRVEYVSAVIGIHADIGCTGLAFHKREKT